MEGNYNFHIYSISGQTLGSGKLKDNSINIEALNSGVFILELENEKEILMKRVKELDKLNLEELREKAKEVIEEKRSEDDKNIKKKFKV